jgi:hypothetical protein
MGKQIHLERVLNGFIISTGEYQNKKSIYPTLEKAFDTIRKLIDDDIRYEKEKRDRVRPIKDSLVRRDA